MAEFVRATFQCQSHLSSSSNQSHRCLERVGRPVNKGPNKCSTTFYASNRGWLQLQKMHQLSDVRSCVCVRASHVFKRIQMGRRWMGCTGCQRDAWNHEKMLAHSHILYNDISYIHMIYIYIYIYYIMDLYNYIYIIYSASFSHTL